MNSKQFNQLKSGAKIKSKDNQYFEVMATTYVEVWESRKAVEVILSDGRVLGFDKMKHFSVVENEEYYREKMGYHQVSFDFHAES